MNAPPSIALLACEVFLSEIRMILCGASNIVSERVLEIGLHDRPDEMRGVLQAAVDELDRLEGIDAIVLAYGLCGCGTAGLRAGRHPLVIPRAHDCITVFLGSKERYADRQAGCPGCYHYTPGWNRARRVPGPERMQALAEEFSRRFDAEDAGFLLDSERDSWKAYDTATFIDLGTPEAAREAAYTKSCAEWLGWKFEHLEGDGKLLRDLLAGPWDDARFLTVPPGMRIALSADERVMRVAGPET